MDFSDGFRTDSPLAYDFSVALKNAVDHSKKEDGTIHPIISAIYGEARGKSCSTIKGNKSTVAGPLSGVLAPNDQDRKDTQRRCKEGGPGPANRETLNGPVSNIADKTQPETPGLIDLHKHEKESPGRFLKSSIIEPDIQEIIVID